MTNGDLHDPPEAPSSGWRPLIGSSAGGAGAAKEESPVPAKEPTVTAVPGPAEERLAFATLTGEFGGEVDRPGGLPDPARPSGRHATSTRLRKVAHECSHQEREAAKLGQHGEGGADGDGAGPRPQSFLDAPLDRFTICGRLGGGGFGQVYVVWQHDLGVHRALKLLPSSARPEPMKTELLLREIRSLALITHPQVLTLFEAVSDPTPRPGFPGGVLGFTMELLAGSLENKLEAGDHLDPKTACRLLAQAARGLAAVHATDRVHQDVKPANLLLTADGRVKLGDLGVAILVEGERRQARRQEDLAGELPADRVPAAPGLDRVSVLGHTGAEGAGTLPYMSPEQVDFPRRGRVGPASDVWSLGATLYECLSGTGHTPFPAPEGLNPTVRRMEVKRAILEDEPAPLPADLQDRPLLSAMLRRALAKEPGDRYPSMTAFAEALEAYVSQGTLTDPRDRSLLARGARLKLAARDFRRRFGRVAAAAVLAAALVGILGWGLPAWRAWRERVEQFRARQAEAATQWQAAQVAEKSGDRVARRSALAVVYRNVPDETLGRQALLALTRALIDEDNADGALRMGREAAYRFAGLPEKAAAWEVVGRAYLANREAGLALAAFRTGLGVKTSGVAVEVQEALRRGEGIARTFYPVETVPMPVPAGFEGGPDNTSFILLPPKEGGPARILLANGPSGRLAILSIPGGQTLAQGQVQPTALGFGLVLPWSFAPGRDGYVFSSRRGIDFVEEAGGRLVTRGSLALAHSLTATKVLFRPTGKNGPEVLAFGGGGTFALIEWNGAGIRPVFSINDPAEQIRFSSGCQMVPWDPEGDGTEGLAVRLGAWNGYCLQYWEPAGPGLRKAAEWPFGEGSRLIAWDRGGPREFITSSYHHPENSQFLRLFSAPPEGLYSLSELGTGPVRVPMDLAWMAKSNLWPLQTGAGPAIGYSRLSGSYSRNGCVFPGADQRWDHYRLGEFHLQLTSQPADIDADNIPESLELRDGQFVLVGLGDAAPPPLPHWEPLAVGDLAVAGDLAFFGAWEDAGKSAQAVAWDLSRDAAARALLFAGRAFHAAGSAGAGDQAWAEAIALKPDLEAEVLRLRAEALAARDPAKAAEALRRLIAREALTETEHAEIKRRAELLAAEAARTKVVDAKGAAVGRLPWVFSDPAHFEPTPQGLGVSISEAVHEYAALPVWVPSQGFVLSARVRVERLDWNSGFAIVMRSSSARVIGASLVTGGETTNPEMSIRIIDRVPGESVEEMHERGTDHDRSINLRLLRFMLDYRPSRREVRLTVVDEETGRTIVGEAFSVDVPFPPGWAEVGFGSRPWTPASEAFIVTRFLVEDVSFTGPLRSLSADERETDVARWEGLVQAAVTEARAGNLAEAKRNIETALDLDRPAVMKWVAARVAVIPPALVESFAVLTREAHPPATPLGALAQACTAQTSDPVQYHALAAVAFAFLGRDDLGGHAEALRAEVARGNANAGLVAVQAAASVRANAGDHAAFAWPRRVIPLAEVAIEAGGEIAAWGYLFRALARWQLRGEEVGAVEDALAAEAGGVEEAVPVVAEWLVQLKRWEKNEPDDPGPCLGLARMARAKGLPDAEEWEKEAARRRLAAAEDR